MKPKRAVAAAVAVAALITCVLVAIHLRGPYYHGKPLRQELVRLTRPWVEGRLEQVLSEVGSKGFPTLVSMLETRGHETRFDRWMRRLAAWQPWLQPLARRSEMDASGEIMVALVSFRILGSRASEAVSEILPLLRDPRLAGDAARAIQFIHPPWRRELLNLTNVMVSPSSGFVKPKYPGSVEIWIAPETDKMIAIWALSSYGTNAVEGVPWILPGLTSTNAQFRFECARALVKIGTPTELALPTMLKELASVNVPSPNQTLPRIPLEHEICGMIGAFRQLGASASNALPILSRFRSDPDEGVRCAASNAIARIQAALEARRTDAAPPH